MITKAPCVGDADVIRVTFLLPANLWANTIALVGDFNNGSSTMLQQSDLDWHTTLNLPTHQTYQYHFLLDDMQWMSDWNGDGFGTDIQGRDVSIVTT